MRCLALLIAAIVLLAACGGGESRPSDTPLPALGDASADRAVSSPVASKAAPAAVLTEPTTPAVRACEAGDLMATWGGSQGYSGGGVMGGLVIANISSSDCYLPDPPTIRFLGEDGVDLGIEANSGSPCFPGLTCAGKLYRVLTPHSDKPPAEYGSTTALRVSWSGHNMATGQCEDPAPVVRGLELALPGLAEAVEVEAGEFPIDFKPCAAQVVVSSYDGEGHFYPLGYTLTQRGDYPVLGEDLVFSARVFNKFPSIPAQFEDECPEFRVLVTDPRDDDADTTVISDSTVRHCLTNRLMTGDASFTFDVSVPVPSDIEWWSCCRVQMFLAPEKVANAPLDYVDMVVYDQRTAEDVEDFTLIGEGYTPRP